MAELFGESKDGIRVYKHLISNGIIRAEIIDYGATVLSIYVPSEFGEKNVVLSYNTLSGYENGSGYLGAVVGRVCNRIENARFSLEGKEYFLNANNGKNCLHGGKDGFSCKVFSLVNSSKNSITLFYKSPDGEGGFDGEVETLVTYTVTDDNSLLIEYKATPACVTPLALTNHAYFNLNGAGDNETILNHELTIDADFFLPVNKELIPLEKQKAEGAFDFKKLKKIGKDFFNKDSQLEICGGYDHNFCLNNKSQFLPVATAVGDKSKIKMQVLTDMTGLQFYSGNFLTETHKKQSGFCLETQFYPNALNRPDFIKPIFSKQNPFISKTAYKFLI